MGIALRYITSPAVAKGVLISFAWVELSKMLSLCRVYIWFSEFFVLVVDYLPFSLTKTWLSEVTWDTLFFFLTGKVYVFASTTGDYTLSLAFPFPCIKDYPYNRAVFSLTSANSFNLSLSRLAMRIDAFSYPVILFYLREPPPSWLIISWS